MENGAVVAVIGMAIGSIVTYLIARRTQSGNIETTDAGSLWASYQRLLAAYVEDNGRLRERCDGLERRLHTAEERERACNEKALNQEMKIERQDIKIDRLERMLAQDVALGAPTEGASL